MKLQELKVFAAKFNGVVELFGHDLIIKMPQTKSQAKENIDGDTFLTNTDNYDRAEQFIKDWEIYWRLKSFIKKKDIEKFIRHKIGTNSTWTIKTLLVIYSRQTAAEKNAEQTCENNNVGFTGFDGHLMASFAKQYIKHFGNKYPEGDITKHFDERLFSAKQLTILKKAMQKYWKQILSVSDEKKLLKQIAADLPATQMRLAI